MLSVAVLRWITGCVDFKASVLFKFFLDLMSESWEGLGFGHGGGLGLDGCFLCDSAAAFPLVNLVRPSPRLRNGLFTLAVSAEAFYMSEL